MANKVRFIDNVKVGAYKVVNGDSGDITINNNEDNRILTATGLSNEINAEPNLIFTSDARLGLGVEAPEAKFEINDATGNDLLLIKNQSNQGIKVNSDGVLQLLEFDTLPSPIKGGITYSGSSFYFGIE
jgi:hypothetical protein